MRVDRFLSNLPRYNRQQVRLLLVEKRVRIDGKVVSDPHSEVLEFSRVEVDDEVLQSGKPARYFMLHKPPGCVSATRDPQHNTLLKSDPFSSRTTLPDSAEVASASTIPNTDARNIPLRVKLTQGTQSWQDEVLMIREGQCWAVDDVRYIGGSVHAPAGTLRQSIENR